MEEILKKLLDDLALVAEENEEIFDTDVREQMFDAVYYGFIKPKSDFKLPAKFGMFTDAGNRQVKAALSDFIIRAAEKADELGLTAGERLAAFQNDEVTGGDEEFTSDDFFGYLESADVFD